MGGVEALRLTVVAQDGCWNDRVNLSTLQFRPTREMRHQLCSSFAAQMPRETTTDTDRLCSATVEDD
jgi:hypothetical protein